MTANENNVQTEIKGDKLVITVDVSKKVLDKAQPSSTGKSRLVASTRGMMKLDHNNLEIGLNVIQK